MENTKMKREYGLARWIMAILTVVICQFLFIHEHISVKVIGTAFFTTACILGSCLGTGISRKMIEMGDKASNHLLRILYYVILIPGFLLLAGVIYVTMNAVFDALSHSNDLGSAAGEAVFFVLVMCSVVILVILPYLQSLIVLILRKVLSGSRENA